MARKIEASEQDKIWAIFAFADDGLPDSLPADEKPVLYPIPPLTLAFRLHVGDLTDDVRRQVRNSMLSQVKKMDVKVHRITAYSFPLALTENGHQRWAGHGLSVTLYPEEKW